jgi:peptidoglycan/LPS O-acetylase OafA/YrhL
MDAPQQFHLGYRRWLDGLRGLAILLVLAFHLGLLPGGSLGVDVFFVLSGFLITALLVEEWQGRAAISLRAFYVRRALRLLPAFLILLGVCGLYSLWLPTSEATALRKQMVVAACYVSNWPRVHGVGMATLGYTWSLSVEEQFYLLWPVLLYGLLRLGLSRRRVFLLVGGGILGSALLRAVLYRLHPVAGPEKTANVIRLYMGLDTRADALLVGCLVGLLAAWDLVPTSRRFVQGAGGAALAAVAGLGFLARYRCLEHSQYYHGLFTGVALMTAVILVRLLAAPSPLGSAVLEWGPLVGLGRISYGLYLFHIPVIRWVPLGRLGWGNLSGTLLAAGLSVAAAVASYFCIERPCLRLKHRVRLGPPPVAALPTAEPGGGPVLPRVAA